jgi:hypothetical protein
MFPMNHVLADSMPPMHWPPNSTVRIVLVKKMIFPIMIYHTVRVVHPFGGRGKMKLQAMGFIGPGCNNLLIGCAFIALRMVTSIHGKQHTKHYNYNS